VLLAREAPVGLVLRRGPSRLFCTIGWDLASDTFKVGQWMKAKVFPFRCDISPDGRYWVGFFSDHSPKRKHCAWTTVAPVPWLKAVAYLPQGDTWFGGGVFVDRKTLWLNGCRTPARPRTGNIPHKLIQEFPYDQMGSDGGECLNIYFKALQLGGWLRMGLVDMPQAISIAMRYETRSEYFARQLVQGWELVKITYATLSYRRHEKPVYFDEHFLVHRQTDRVVEYRDWEWADWRDGRLLWANKGCLHSAQVGLEGIEQERLLHDLRGMTFQERKAPY
jgi:hypothetical protein